MRGQVENGVVHKMFICGKDLESVGAGLIPPSEIPGMSAPGGHKARPYNSEVFGRSLNLFENNLAKRQ